MIELFRAVMIEERQSIQNLGAFFNPIGIEVKYFTTSLDGAKAYASLAEAAFGDGPFAFVQTTIAEDKILAEMRVIVDREIDTVVVPTNLLIDLSKPVLLD